MKILVLGAGAIGGYFGGRLLESGADVTFLVRSPRAEQLARDGLIIESSSGNFKQKVNVITSCEKIASPDIIILTCKAYALDGALNTISGCIGPDTVILPLLNGVAHYDCIEQRFPGCTVWGGLAHLGVTLTNEGVIQHFTRHQVLMFGLRKGGDNERSSVLANKFLKAFQATMIATSLDVQYRPSIDQDLWDKLVFLSTLAGTTCLMRADIGTILETEHGHPFILDLLGECSVIAKAEGFAPNPDQMTRYRHQLTERGSPSKASMLRDIERGAPTEADHILGDMVARAAKYDIPAPLLKVAYTHLQAYERQL